MAAARKHQISRLSTWNGSLAPFQPAVGGSCRAGHQLAVCRSLHAAPASSQDRLVDPAKLQDLVRFPFYDFIQLAQRSEASGLILMPLRPLPKPKLFSAGIRWNFGGSPVQCHHSQCCFSVYQHRTQQSVPAVSTVRSAAAASRSCAQCCMQWMAASQQAASCRSKLFTVPCAAL